MKEIYKTPKYTDIKHISEWMTFSDNERSLFQNYITEYFVENEENISKKDEISLNDKVKAIFSNKL